jgi:hypothetical protein
MLGMGVAGRGESGGVGGSDRQAARLRGYGAVDSNVGVTLFQRPGPERSTTTFVSSLVAGDGRS